MQTKNQFHIGTVLKSKVADESEWILLGDVPAPVATLLGHSNASPGQTYSVISRTDGTVPARCIETSLLGVLYRKSDEA